MCSCMWPWCDATGRRQVLYLRDCLCKLQLLYTIVRCGVVLAQTLESNLQTLPRIVLARSTVCKEPTTLDDSFLNHDFLNRHQFAFTNNSPAVLLPHNSSMLQMKQDRKKVSSRFESDWMMARAVLQHHGNSGCGIKACPWIFPPFLLVANVKGERGKKRTSRSWWRFATCCALNP